MTYSLPSPRKRENNSTKKRKKKTTKTVCTLQTETALQSGCGNVRGAAGTRCVGQSGASVELPPGALAPHQPQLGDVAVDRRFLIPSPGRAQPNGEKLGSGHRYAGTKSREKGRSRQCGAESRSPRQRAGAEGCRAPAHDAG